jgi:hypothetical protein
MRVVVDLCAVDLRSSHQFEDEIGAASSENGLFIAKMKFSVQTGNDRRTEAQKTNPRNMDASLNWHRGRDRISYFRDESDGNVLAPV